MNTEFTRLSAPGWLPSGRHLWRAQLANGVALVLLSCPAGHAGPAIAPADDALGPAAGDAPPPAAAPAAGPHESNSAKDDLAASQQRIAERYKVLRDKLTHMADLLAASNPRQAALLREAVGKSNDLGIDERLANIALLLRDQQLSAGVRSQTEVQRDLAKIIDLLLSEDRSKRLESEKERIRNYLKWLSALIKDQKSLEAETGRSDDVPALAERQGKLAERAVELANRIERNESPRETTPPSAERPSQRPTDNKPDDRPKPDGKTPMPPRGTPSQEPAPLEGAPPPGAAPPSGQPPQQGETPRPSPPQGSPPQGNPPQGSPPQPERAPSQPGQPGEAPPSGAPDSAEEQPNQEGSPPGPQQGHPAQQRIERAQQRMQEAQQQLKQAEKEGAKSRQLEALQELEQAKAEFEAILRQLREEEQVQTLKLLEARLSAMLKLQNEVWEGTQRVDRKPEEQRDHDDEIETGRLARRETEIGVEADKALTLLREEATAIAFVEALTEIRLEMGQVVELLSRGKTGALTQGTEEEIVKSLEEMLATTKKARKERENQKNQPPKQQGDSGEAPPLVDNLAQIKMIRSMQVRINNQTQRYLDAITAASASDRAELSQALKRLSDSQERVRRITRDMAAGRNQ